MKSLIPTEEFSGEREKPLDFVISIARTQHNRTLTGWLSRVATQIAQPSLLASQWQHNGATGGKQAKHHTNEALINRRSLLDTQVHSLGRRAAIRPQQSNLKLIYISTNDRPVGL